MKRHRLYLFCVISYHNVPNKQLLDEVEQQWRYLQATFYVVSLSRLRWFDVLQQSEFFLESLSEKKVK